MDLDGPTVPDIGQPACPSLLPEEISEMQWLSKGFFGTVYSGIWNHSNALKRVALKEVEVVSREQYILSLLLGHTCPGLITFLGSVEVDNKHFLVSDLVIGGSLAQFLYPPEDTKYPTLDTPTTQAVLIKSLMNIAGGLAFLHSCNPPIYHLDISSTNILISYSLEETKLCDFGHADFDHVLRADRCWNRLYGAPELWIDGVTKSKADTFSFGLILWECFLSHRSPVDHMGTEIPVRSPEDALQQWRANLGNKNRPWIAREVYLSSFHERVHSMVVRSWVHDPLHRNLTFDVIYACLNSITSNIFAFPEENNYNDTNPSMVRLVIEGGGNIVDPYGDQIGGDIPEPTIKRRRSVG